MTELIFTTKPLLSVGAFLDTTKLTSNDILYAKASSLGTMIYFGGKNITLQLAMLIGLQLGFSDDINQYYLPLEGNTFTINMLNTKLSRILGGTPNAKGIRIFRE